MNKTRIWIIVAVVVALGGGLGLGALLFGGDSSDDVDSATATTSSPSSDDDSTTTTGGDEQGPTTTESQPATTLPDLPATTVPTAGLAGPELELAEAINKAHQLTYHIVLQDNDPEAPNSTELWRRLPEARRDTHIGSEGQALVTSEFRSPTLGHIGCLLDSAGVVSEEQVTCVRAPADALDPADPVLGVVDPAAGPVTVTDETLGGAPIRCFSQTIDAENHVACFDEEGIPAVLDGGDGRLERVGEPERGITDDVFVPPDAAAVEGSDDEDGGGSA